jgi:hypothetical protein
MVPFHGLKKLWGRIQNLLSEGKEVAQSAPNLQMVVGRGQIERELWLGEASGLGTLSPEPAPPEVQIVVELGNLVPRKFLGPQKISQRISLSVSKGLNENFPEGFL